MHQAAEFDEMMPVPTITGQAGSLNAKHGANLSRADFRNEMLEPRTFDLAGPRASKILVDYLDPLEAKLASVVGQAILPTLAFLVVNHLPRRRLTNIDDGAPLQMVRRYFRIHASSPKSGPVGSVAAFNNRSASAIASSRCLSSGNIIGVLSQNSRFICVVSGIFLGSIRGLPCPLFQ